jgi:hypothetical protein
MSESLNSLNLSEMDNSLTEILKNEYVSTFFIMLVSLYGGLIAPKLNYRIAKFLDTQLFSLLSLLVIGYVATKNHSIAIVCLLAYLITINTINKHNVNDVLLGVIVVNKPVSPRRERKPVSPRKEVKPVSPRKEVKPVSPRKEEKPVSPRKEERSSNIVEKMEEEMEETFGIEGFNMTDIYSNF